MKKIILCLSWILVLSGCVAVKPEQPVVVSGAIGYVSNKVLPKNAMVTIALVDMDTPGAVISQKSFEVLTQPILFKFTLPADKIDDGINYGVVALISHNNNVLYQSYRRYPVISNKTFVAKLMLKPTQKVH
ncbi:MAG: YbaY family lipoprotein [Shewanellaceae bacterium]|nr:YbaY family lipoprotein [Shewanellaceae bacterium]